MQSISFVFLCELSVFARESVVKIMNDKTKLLIIDDDVALCESLVDILQLEGYCVDIVHNAADGINKVESSFYNILLLDMKLPDSDGISVLEKVKEVSRDTEVIIFTAHAEMDIVIKAMDRDAFSFLPKPYEIPYLITILNKALEKQKIILENRNLYQQTIKEEREWEDTFDSISDLVSIHDINFNITRCNKALAKKLNMPFADIIGKKCHEVFHFKSAPQHKCPLVRCRDSLKSEVDEQECFGGTFQMTCFPRFDEEGMFKGVVHIARDITLDKLSEEELLRYEYIVSSTSDLMALLDVDCVYKSVNNSYAEAFNMTKNDVVGKYVSDVLGKEIFEKVVRPRIKHCLKGEEVSYQQWFNLPAYNSRFMDIHYYPYKDREGCIKGVVVNARDITGNKQSEDAMNTLVVSAAENEGIKFFKQIVSSLYDWLGVDCVILAQLDDETSETSLAMKKDGEFVESFSYELQGSPCGDVSKNGFRHYPDGIIDLFPDDESLVQWNMSGYVGVPLIAESGDCIGTLCALSKRRLELPPGAKNVFHIISSRASVEIERFKANRTLQQQILQLTALNRLSKKIGASLSLDNVVQAGIEGIIDAVNPDLALFFLLDGDKLILQDFGPKNGKYAHNETPVHCVGECLCGMAVSEKNTMYSIDIHSDTRCSWEECKQAGLRSFAAIPLLIGNDILGVLGVASATKCVFEEQDAFLQIVTNEISSGLQNALLHQEVQGHAKELEEEIIRREETEKEIKNQRDFLHNVFESIPDPFYVINANDFTIKMANSALNAGDLSKNVTCHELTHKSSIPCDDINNICPLEEVKNTGQSVTREHLHYDVNGKKKYVQIHAYPIFNDKGDIIQMIEYTRDITDIKISETSLMESEERYRSLIEAISTVIWTSDSSGGFATPQLSWEKYTGQPWSDHKDYGWTKMIRPDDVERILKVWKKANREMSLYETWGHIWNENLKEWRDFEVRAVPVKNADGSLREWIGVITDITERKQAEETVQTLSQAIEQSTASIVITDIEGNIIYVNPKFCSLTEYDRMELIGQNPRILKSGETSDADYVEIWKTITSGSSWTGMLHNKKKSGELYWEQAVISPVWNDKGKIIQFLGVKEDVTERMKSESDIKHLASFPQLNVNPILEVDYTGNIVFKNVAAMNTIERLVDNGNLNLFVPDNITEILEILKEGEKEQHYREVEIENHIFGENIHLVQDFNVLRIYARDITEEKDMAEKLTVSYKMASLGRLTAGVFHEILNPVNIISSHIQLLLMEAEHGSQTEEDLKSVQEEIVRVTKITDSLLRFSRKEGSDSTQVEINDLLERSISIVEPDMKLNNINFIREFDKRLLMITANSNELRQVIMNLLNNAGDAMPEGGTITIRSENIKADGGTFVRIVVKDTGQGIENEKLQKVFEPFFTTKKEGKGVGLGLSTSFTIIENHGGNISAKSTLGKGTEFIIDLPVRLHKIEEI